MTDTKKKATDDAEEPQIDPRLKEKAGETTKPSTSPVSPTEQRRENDSDANRDSDGQRKRAEEGL